MDSPSSSQPGSARLSAGEWTTSQPPALTEVLGRVFSFPRTVARHRDLIYSSTKRELATRFQGTLLGFLWPLVHPLFIFAVYYFIFTKLLSFKMPALPPGQESAMGVYMFIGVLVWAAFAESIGMGCNVIVDNGNLIKKLAFPSEILPLNIVLVNIVTMLFGVAMYLVGTAATPVWAFPSSLLAWVPLLLFLQILFTYGLTLILSTLQVFLRDTAQVVAIAVTVWMFLTPLFWVPEAIPQIVDYVPWIQMNPMNHLVFAWREVLMNVSGVLSTVQSSVNGDTIWRANEALRDAGIAESKLLSFENPSTEAIARVNQKLVEIGAPELHVTQLNLTHDLAHSVGVFSIWAVAVFVIGYSFFIMAQRRFADEV